MIGVRVVPDNSTYVSSVSLVTSFDSQSTFRGSVGTTRQLIVTATFDDGNVYSDVASQLSWVSVDTLFNFSSSYSGGASVGSSGMATLHANHHRQVVFTASSVECTLDGTVASVVAVSQSGSQSVWCNLVAGADGEVDIGSDFGRQLPYVTSAAVASGGGVIDVPVRVRSVLSGLAAFQLSVTFDDSVMVAIGCSIGSQWSGEFDCTLNDPRDEVLFVGSATSGQPTGTGIHIGTVQFRVVAEGLHRPVDSAMRGLG